jgi:hypothetical protein
VIARSLVMGSSSAGPFDDGRRVYATRDPGASIGSPGTALDHFPRPTDRF